MRYLLVTLAAVLLGGCGYVGDPLPPALNIPQPVGELSAIQRGDELLVTFRTPANTTEDLPIREFDAVEVRLASAGGETVVPVPDAEPGSTATLRLPAQKWAGQALEVSARTKARRGRQSDWSPAVALTPRAPLPVPEVKVASDPAGIRLSWQTVPGASYRISRGEAKAMMIPAGTVDKSEFIDTAVSLGREYTYVVQAFVGPVESAMSAPVSVVAADTFPPEAPRGLTAVAGGRSVQLLWERNTEPDLAGYRVYRAEGTGAFAVLIDTVAEVSFTDRQVSSGGSYRYQVTALDRSGNESKASVETQATLP